MTFRNLGCSSGTFRASFNGWSSTFNLSRSLRVGFRVSWGGPVGSRSVKDCLKDLPETFFQSFSFSFHYRLEKADCWLLVLFENIGCCFRGHSSSREGVDCNSAIFVHEFRGFFRSRLNVLFSL